MVALPPDELRPIRGYIHRGNQMANVDPVITYYCYYYAISQALEKKLHAKNDECKAYMLSLMDETEQRKTDLGDNELVTDDMAASAYVENFATRVFTSASNAVEERRATQKTPDSLQAAATFLELTKVFGEVDPEVQKKIKYAKFHAARILKAMKEGGEINLPPPTPVEETPGVEELQPRVEDAPDDYYTSGPAQSPRPTSSVGRPGSAAGRSTSSVGRAPSPPPNVSAHIDTTSPTSPTLLTQPGAGTESPYFPPVPEIHEPGPSSLAPPPAVSPSNTTLPEMHSFPEPSLPSPPVALPSPPATLATSPPPPPQVQSQVSQNPFYQSHQAAPTVQTPIGQANTHLPPVASQSPAAGMYGTQGGIGAGQGGGNAGGYGGGYGGGQGGRKKEVTPEDIAKAQKFAKWAISALDYDDVENAIEQFRKGLELLGGL